METKGSQISAALESEGSSLHGNAKTSLAIEQNWSKCEKDGKLSRRDRE